MNIYRVFSFLSYTFLFINQRQKKVLREILAGKDKIPSASEMWNTSFCLFARKAKQEMLKVATLDEQYAAASLRQFLLMQSQKSNSHQFSRMHYASMFPWYNSFLFVSLFGTLTTYSFVQFLFGTAAKKWTKGFYSYSNMKYHGAADKFWWPF